MILYHKGTEDLCECPASFTCSANSNCERGIHVTVKWVTIIITIID